MSAEAPSAPGGRASALAPVARGLLVTTLCVSAWFLLSALLPFPPADDSLPVVAVLAGYGVMAAGLVRRELHACLQALGPLGGRLASDPEATTAALFSYRGAAGGAAVGAVLGVVLAVFDPQQGSGLRSEEYWRIDLVFWVPMMVFLFALVGAGVAIMLRVTAALVAMGRSMEGLDLLGLQRIEPLPRYALRTSLLWIVGTSIAALSALQGELTVAVGALMAGVVVMAIAILLLPLRGVRARVQEVKGAELERVDDALRDARRTLLSGDGSASELTDLLAWRSFVAARPEWPLDAGALTRFLLYVAIGLGSWVGAALVERLLDLAVG